MSSTLNRMYPPCNSLSFLLFSIYCIGDVYPSRFLNNYTQKKQIMLLTIKHTSTSLNSLHFGRPKY